MKNSTVESDCQYFLVKTEGSLLSSLSRENCFVKNSFKSSAFSEKSMINLSLCKKDEIQDLLLLSLLKLLFQFCFSSH